MRLANHRPRTQNQQQKCWRVVPVPLWYKHRTRPCCFRNNGKALLGRADRTVSSNSRGVVYSASPSGRSHICLRERSQLNSVFSADKARFTRNSLFFQFVITLYFPLLFQYSTLHTKCYSVFSRQI